VPFQRFAKYKAMNSEFSHCNNKKEFFVEVIHSTQNQKSFNQSGQQNIRLMKWKLKMQQINVFWESQTKFRPTTHHQDALDYVFLIQ